MFGFQCFWQTHQPLGLLSFLGMMLNPPGPRFLRICGSDASSKSLLRAEFSSQKEMERCSHVLMRTLRGCWLLLPVTHRSKVQLEQDEGQHQEHDNAWEYDSWQGERRDQSLKSSAKSMAYTTISFRGRARASLLVVATKMQARVAWRQPKGRRSISKQAAGIRAARLQND